MLKSTKQESSPTKKCLLNSNQPSLNQLVEKGHQQRQQHLQKELLQREHQVELQFKKTYLLKKRRLRLLLISLKR